MADQVLAKAFNSQSDKPISSVAVGSRDTYLVDFGQSFCPILLLRSKKSSKAFFFIDQIQFFTVAINQIFQAIMLAA